MNWGVHLKTHSFERTMSSSGHWALLNSLLFLSINSKTFLLNWLYGNSSLLYQSNSGSSKKGSFLEICSFLKYGYLAMPETYG